MSGKHDKKLDDEQAAKLLLTGPIVIRGLGRSVKDALRPGRPSRHRAFIAPEPDTAAPEAVAAAPLPSTPAIGPALPDDRSSSDDADSTTTQVEPVEDDSFPPASAVAQTEAADGRGEDRVGARRRNDGSLDDLGEPRSDAPVRNALEITVAPVSDGLAALEDSAGGPVAVIEEDGDQELEADSEAQQSSEGAVAPTVDLVDDFAVIEGTEDSEDCNGLVADAETPGVASSVDSSSDDAGPDAASSDAVDPDAVDPDAVDPDAADSDGLDGDRADADVAEVNAESADDEDAFAAEQTDAAEPVKDLDAPWDEPEMSGADDVVVDESAPVAEADVEVASDETLDPVGEHTPDSAAAPAVDFGDPSADAEPASDEEFVVADNPIEVLAEGEAATDDTSGLQEASDEPTSGKEVDSDSMSEVDEALAPVDEIASSRDATRAVTWVQAAQVLLHVPASPELQFEPDDSARAIEPVDDHSIVEPSTMEETENVDEVRADALESADEVEAGEPESANAVELLGAQGSLVGGVENDSSNAPESLEISASAEEEPESDVTVGNTEEPSPDEAVGEAPDETLDEPLDLTEPVDGDAPAAGGSDGDSVAPEPEEGSEVEEPAADADIVRLEEQPSSDEPEGMAEPTSEESAPDPAADAAEDDLDHAAAELAEDVAAAWTDDLADRADEPPVDAETESGREPVQQPDGTGAVLADLLGDRGWTTAEELFSRPARLSDEHGEAADEQSKSEQEQESATAGDDVPEASSAPVLAEESAADVDDGGEPTRVADPAGEAVDASTPSRDETEPIVESAVAATVATPSITGAARPAPKPERTFRPPRRDRPMRARFGREAIGIAVLVVLALVCGGLITAVVLKTHRDAAIAAREAANYTPPPLATPEPTATGPVLAVIGDGTTSSAASGVTASNRWSALLGKSLGGTVDVDASKGMGYASKGSSGETFVQAAAKLPSNAEVVVFFGGAEDANVSTLSLAKAATDAFATAKEQAPDAKLIVVGPAISGGVNEADLTVIRNGLRTAAGVVKATWVDPIDQEWLSTAKQAASSPSALTAADEKTLASKLGAVIKKALA